MSWSNPLTVIKDTGGKKYVVKSEVITMPDSAGANIVTQYTTAIDEDISNKKFVILAKVVEACAGNGGLKIAVQASLDGITYVDVDATVDITLDTTGLNSAAGVGITTNYEAPYYRLKLYTDGTDTQDSCQIQVSYAVRFGN